MEAEHVQWRVLRDLKEAEEDMEQEEGGILSHQNLLPLADLVQTVTGVGGSDMGLADRETVEVSGTLVNARLEAVSNRTKYKS